MTGRVLAAKIQRQACTSVEAARRGFSRLQRSVSVRCELELLLRTRLVIESHARGMPIVTERSIARLACSSADT